MVQNNGCVGADTPIARHGPRTRNSEARAGRTAREMLHAAEPELHAVIQHPQRTARARRPSPTVPNLLARKSRAPSGTCRLAVVRPVGHHDVGETAAAADVTEAERTFGPATRRPAP